jgi:hypothetical protein
MRRIVGSAVLLAILLGFGDAREAAGEDPPAKAAPAPDAGEARAAWIAERWRLAGAGRRASRRSGGSWPRIAGATARGP